MAGCERQGLYEGLSHFLVMSFLVSQSLHSKIMGIIHAKLQHESKLDFFYKCILMIRFTFYHCFTKDALQWQTNTDISAYNL